MSKIALAEKARRLLARGSLVATSPCELTAHRSFVKAAAAYDGWQIQRFNAADDDPDWRPASAVWAPAHQVLSAPRLTDDGYISAAATPSMRFQLHVGSTV